MSDTAVLKRLWASSGVTEMSMSRLVVAFGGEIVREWSIVGKTESIRRQHDALRTALDDSPSFPSLFFRLEGSWGPAPGKPHCLFLRIADIKGLDLQEGIEDPASE